MGLFLHSGGGQGLSSLIKVTEKLWGQITLFLLLLLLPDSLQEAH